MLSSGTYLVELSSDAQAVLADNAIDIIRELQREGIDVRRGALPEKVPSEEGGKEILLVLLAGSVSAYVIASAVTKILDSLGRNKKYLATRQILSSVLDEAGNPVKDFSW